MPDDPGQPKLGAHGGKRVKGTQNTDVTLHSRGNSRAYIVARLERDGYTYWLEEIRARRVSSFAAAVELGWKRRPPTLHGEDFNQARLRRHAVVDVKSLIG